MKVFLSHGRSEPALEFADKLAAQVERAGFKSLRPETALSSKAEVSGQLKRQLEDCDAYVFLIDSQAALQTLPFDLGDIRPSAVIERLKVFREEKAKLKSEWAERIPWTNLVRTATQVART